MKKIPFAHPDQHISLTNEQLTFPAGVAVGPDAAVYAIKGSTYIAVGEGKSFGLRTTEACHAEEFGREHK